MRGRDQNVLDQRLTVVRSFLQFLTPSPPPCHFFDLVFEGKGENKALAQGARRFVEPIASHCHLHSYSLCMAGHKSQTPFPPSIYGRH